LCQQIGETPRLFPALGGLCAFYIERAELQTARELAERMFALATSVQDPVLLMWAHLALGTIRYLLGELILSRKHFEQSLALYIPQQRRFLNFVSDSGVHCLSYLGRLLWLLGYPNQALKRSQEALTLARELVHPFSLAFASTPAIWVSLRCGRPQAA